MTEHTPGPWRVDRLKYNDEIVIRANDEVEFICMAFGDRKNQNAKLIAAAPDLLTNLRHLVGLYHAKVAPSPQTIEEASAAIAKAVALSSAKRECDP